MLFSLSLNDEILLSYLRNWCIMGGYLALLVQNPLMMFTGSSPGKDSFHCNSLAICNPLLLLHPGRRGLAMQTAGKCH